MYCAQCGKAVTSDAKFCSSCGAAIGGDPVSVAKAEISPERGQSKVFFDDGGIFVSDVVFKTADGSSYPIRNISSVAVVRKPPSGIIIAVALVITLFALFMMAGSVGFGLFILLIAAPFWANVFTQPYRLEIGSGGRVQVAISSKTQDRLQQIAHSINDAVGFLQHGTAG